MTPLYLGWQYATPTSRPGAAAAPAGAARAAALSTDWLAAQRREESLIARPLRVAAAAATVIALALAACVAAGLVPAIIAAPAIAACLAGRRAERLRDLAGANGCCGGRIDAERLRVERFRADQETRLHAGAGRARAAGRPVAGAAVRLREPEAVVRRPRSRRDRPGGRRGRHAGRLVGDADHGRRLPARHGRRGDRRRPVRRGRRGRPGRPSARRQAAYRRPSGCCRTTCRGSTSRRRSRPGSSRTSSRSRSAWPRSTAPRGTSPSTRPYSTASSRCSTAMARVPSRCAGSRPRCGHSPRSVTRARTWRPGCSPSARPGRSRAVRPGRHRPRGP